MKRSLPTGAWIAGGLIAAALIIPGVSYAVASQMQIVGTNGTTVADVSKAHQLLTAPVAPSSLFTTEGGFGVLTSGCEPIGSVPSGKAAVIHQITLDISSGSSLDSGYIFASSGCSANSLVGEFNFGGPATQVLTFGDGFTVPTGGGISVSVVHGSTVADEVDAYVSGDSVPTAAVPHGATVIRQQPLAAFMHH